MECAVIIMIVAVIAWGIYFFLSIESNNYSGWAPTDKNKVVEPFDADFRSKPGNENGLSGVYTGDVDAWDKPYMLQYAKPETPFAQQYYKLNNYNPNIEVTTKDRIFDPNLRNRDF